MPNVTGHHIIFDVFCTKLFFLITKMRVATEEFFCYVVLLLLNWSWSWSYNFGLGLDLGLILLVLVLVLQFWSWSWSYSFGLDLGLGLNILVLFPSLICAAGLLILQYWSGVMCSGLLAENTNRAAAFRNITREQATSKYRTLKEKLQQAP